MLPQLAEQLICKRFHREEQHRAALVNRIVELWEARIATFVAVEAEKQREREESARGAQMAVQVVVMPDGRGERTAVQGNPAFFFPQHGLASSCTIHWFGTHGEFAGPKPMEIATSRPRILPRRPGWTADRRRLCSRCRRQKRRIGHMESEMFVQEKADDMSCSIVGKPCEWNGQIAAFGCFRRDSGI